MPYNISKACVNRSMKYLNELLEKKRTVTFPAHAPGRLTYQLREAVYAAVRHPEFKRYHCLYEDYRFHPRTGWVEAEFIGASDGAGPAPPAVTVAEAKQLLEVVGACIKFGPKADELYFPSAILSVEDLKTLVVWGKTDGWKLISHDEKGITLTRRAGVDEAFLWRAEEEKP
jgi:hypothetical protein